MTVSSKHAALANKLVKMNADIVKRIDELYAVLVDIKDKTLPEVNDKIGDLRFEDNDKKAAIMERDIRDNLKAIDANIFSVQKIARELVARAESLERAADLTHTHGSGKSSQLLYRAVTPQKGEEW